MIELRRLGSRFMLLSQLLSLVFPVMLAVDPNCNYYQNMTVGVTYYIYNREYPGKYGPNQNCLWVAVAPEQYLVEAVCQLEIPNSAGCQDERLLISPTGLPGLENANVFCGFDNKTLVSESNTISIGLQTSWMAQGGRFICSLTTKFVSPPQCDCGWKNPRRIVGGTETKINEYPMMAGLIDLENKDLFCGATIIATKYVLTAAHCFNTKTPQTTGVLVGDHNISSGGETNKAALLLTTKFIIHPQYAATTMVHDLGIVQTKTPIPYSWAVGPACLPFYYYLESFAGQTVVALGWGTTEFTGPSSDVLLQTDLNVLDKPQCLNKINGTGDQLCTFREDHDACQKDSGGPLLWFDPNSFRMHLVGIISYGRGCASQYPAVNTRVTSYLSWILSKTSDAAYCVKGDN